MAAERFDLAIVGGGINGCGIARDAAGRGLRVLLVERDDLASATSSASTKLIHGGLRYLEYYEFRLVREALKEREVLLRAAPHLIHPLTFVLPHHSGLRPAWLIRLGLFLYDHLGGRDLLPPSVRIDLERDARGAPLHPRFRRGFAYADCQVDDSRLVVLNAVDAAERGADIRTRTECRKAERSGEHWRLTLVDRLSGRKTTIAARALVNATGPWGSSFLAECVGVEPHARIRLVKGSHIILPRLFSHDSAYIFQNVDGRIVFAIPYESAFTLVGTTDVDYGGDPSDVAISSEEIDYLLAVLKTYFKRAISPDDVVHTFAGVRALYDDGAREARAATRDYVLELDAQAGQGEDEGAGAARNRGRETDAAPLPPLLSIFGGKITTYRRLAEAALARLAPYLPGMGPSWTQVAPLPGGDFSHEQFDDLVVALSKAHPELERGTAHRLVRAYGTRAEHVITGPTEGRGMSFGAGLCEAEVRYLISREWARTADDILWRRSKLGLHMSESERGRLAHWLSSELGLVSEGAGSAGERDATAERAAGMGELGASRRL